MSFERLLSDDELELLATPLSITLERAAEGKDASQLPWLIEQLDAECLAIYDAYVSWIGVLQRFIIANGDEADHDRALGWAAEYAIRPFVQAFAGTTVRERVERIAERLRASGSTFEVIETADRVRFSCEVWGPVRWWREPEEWQKTAARKREGQRYYYPSYGYFGKSFPAMPVLSGARPLLRGRDSLPSVLATEVQFLESIPIELFGAPLAVIGLGESPTDVVTLDVYKDSANVPEAAYSAVSLARPTGPSGLSDDLTEQIFTDDELVQLAIPLTLQLEQAADRSDWVAMRALTERMDEELVGAKDSLGVMIAALLSWIARRHGEAAAEVALEETAAVVMAPYVDHVRNLGPAESIRAWAVAWRSHGSTFWIEEHEETFIFRGQPLGACARMWATAYQPTVERISDSRVRYPTFGSFNPPASFHIMREPRAVTHGEIGHPIYSCHCVMLHEIYPIEQLGYPLWVETHPIDDRDGETVHLHYKDPSAWPERYYEAVGKSKPTATPA